ncbi:hypothetical protein [Actinomyces oris]|uniref:hypothetical protein n=1 Tax=Actinomyces oris TaxID=544580 RepID=UPI000A47E40C|nr:hypothetical protein [Actinomyces oris]
MPENTPPQLPDATQGRPRHWHVLDPDKDVPDECESKTPTLFWYQQLINVLTAQKPWLPKVPAIEVANRLAHLIAVVEDAEQGRLKSPENKTHSPWGPINTVQHPLPMWELRILFEANVPDWDSDFQDSEATDEEVEEWKTLCERDKTPDGILLRTFFVEPPAAHRTAVLSTYYKQTWGLTECDIEHRQDAEIRAAELQLRRSPNWGIRWSGRWIDGLNTLKDGLSHSTSDSTASEPR